MWASGLANHTFIWVLFNTPARPERALSPQSQRALGLTLAGCRQMSSLTVTFLIPDSVALKGFRGAV